MVQNSLLSEQLKPRCCRRSERGGGAVFQVDRHECKCVVYFAKVNWKAGPTVLPSLQAESVRQTYKELGSGQLYCVGQ